MKKILNKLAIVLVLFSFNMLNAQEQVFNDKVFLKQGSVLVGEITDFQPGVELTIRLRSGNILNLKDNQIRRVKMYQASEEKAIIKNQTLPLRDMKLYYETDFAFLSGLSGLGVSISQNVLFQHTSRLAYGAGIGLDNYRMAPGQSIFPLYANGKYNLTNSRNSPYIGLKLGYGFAFTNEDENITEASGGLMTNPYFGIRLGSRGTIFNFFSGVKIQKADYVFTRPWETRTEDILFKRLLLGMSVMF